MDSPIVLLGAALDAAWALLFELPEFGWTPRPAPAPVTVGEALIRRLLDDMGHMHTYRAPA